MTLDGAHSQEWKEALDILVAFQAAIKRDMKYYGLAPGAATPCFELDFRGLKYRVGRYGFIQDLAVDLLQYEGFPYVALAVDRYKPEEWDWFVGEALLERAVALKAETKEKIKNG